MNDTKNLSDDQKRGIIGHVGSILGVVNPKGTVEVKPSACIATSPCYEITIFVGPDDGTGTPNERGVIKFRDRASMEEFDKALTEFVHQVYGATEKTDENIPLWDKSDLT